MATETMNSKERYEAAISLEEPDRVPITPLMCTAASITLLGLDTEEVYGGGLITMLEAEIKAFDEYGGWDTATPLIPPNGFTVAGLKTRLPNNDFPELQILEEENMVLEDYDIIAEIGYASYLIQHLVPRITKYNEDGITQMIMELISFYPQMVAEWDKREVPFQFANWHSHPFFGFSLARSMIKFTEDLYYHPDKVERALKKAIPDFIQSSLNFCELTGCKVAACVEERAGAFFYPLHIFERFWWPYTMEIVDAFWSKGIKTWFHLDTNWEKNLPYFKQLPRGSAIIDLDGTTDVFKAKEMLSDHLCISTDVPAALLSLGKPQEVEAYCKKLIDEVGKGGGCLLTTGCTVPGRVQPENFRAMIETGKTYELTKK